MCCLEQHKLHDAILAADAALAECARLQQTLVSLDEAAARIAASALTVRERAIQLRDTGDAGHARVEAVRVELHAAVDARCDRLSTSLG